MKIVHCSMTPCAGAIEALSSAIRDHTEHDSRWVGTGPHVNNLTFSQDTTWGHVEAFDLLAAADVLVLHNSLDHETDAPPVRDFLEGDPAKKCVGFYHSHPDTDTCAGAKDLVGAGFPHFCVAQYQALFFDAAIPIRNVIRFDRSDWPRRGRTVDGKVRIGYSPTFRLSQHGQEPGSVMWWHSKGFDVTMAVLRELERRDDVELCVIEGCAYDYAIRMKAECDILIDEVVTGSYHRSTLEGLALGIPTVVNVNADVWGVMGAAAGLDGDDPFPFVLADAETLRETLDRLIAMTREERLEIGNRSMGWMDKHWHPREIAREFCGLLEQCPNYGQVVHGPDVR